MNVTIQQCHKPPYGLMAFFPPKITGSWRRKPPEIQGWFLMPSLHRKMIRSPCWGKSFTSI